MGLGYHTGSISHVILFFLANHNPMFLTELDIYLILRSYQPGIAKVPLLPGAIYTTSGYAVSTTTLVYALSCDSMWSKCQYTPIEYVYSESQFQHLEVDLAKDSSLKTPSNIWTCSFLDVCTFSHYKHKLSVKHWC